MNNKVVGINKIAVYLYSIIADEFKSRVLKKY